MSKQIDSKNTDTSNELYTLLANVKNLGQTKMLDILLHNRGYITSIEYNLTDNDLAKKIIEYCKDKNIDLVNVC